MTRVNAGHPLVPFQKELKKDILLRMRKPLHRFLLFCVGLKSFPGLGACFYRTGQLLLQIGYDQLQIGYDQLQIGYDQLQIGYDQFRVQKLKTN